MLGEGSLAPTQTLAGEVTAAVVWAVAIVVITAPLAVRLYRRTVSFNASFEGSAETALSSSPDRG